MSVVVIDTDVASSLLRTRLPEATARQLTCCTPAVTFVTIGELTKWTLVRNWGPRSLASMRAFLSQMVVLPYDQRVAARWGELQAYAQLRGRPRPARSCHYRPQLRAITRPTRRYWPEERKFEQDDPQRN